MDAERFDAVVIGGAQAGLSAGFHLMRSGRSFVILDANERVGDSWRARYDSLRLFTPSKYVSLPGWRYPGNRAAMPTRDEMADYLEAYAEQLDLPVRTGIHVDDLAREGDRYVLRAGDRRFEATNIIVASGAHREARVPAIARDLDPSIVQLHSTEYRNPSQLREGGVLVVGAGNSGADISMEVVRTHPTWLSGREHGHIPVDIDTWVARHVAFPVIRFVGVHVLTLRTPLGRKAFRDYLAKGDPLVRVKPKQLLRAGVQRVPRTVGVAAGVPILEDGQALTVTNVIWCTGFRHDLSWIDLPIFAEDGTPLHDRGVVTTEPGLYFVGLPFQYAAASDVLPGVGRDAAYVVKQLLRRSSPQVRRTGVAIA